jgi:hypothetical protein
MPGPEATNALRRDQLTYRYAKADSTQLLPSDQLWATNLETLLQALRANLSRAQPWSTAARRPRGSRIQGNLLSGLGCIGLTRDRTESGILVGNGRWSWAKTVEAR